MAFSPQSFAQKREQLLANGVLMMDPETVYVEDTVTVLAGTVLLPNTILRGETTIGAHCEIGPNTMIVNSTIGDNVIINSSQCNDSTIGDGCHIGPFACIRMNVTLGKEIRVGNFVEVKNSNIGDRTQMAHLTYVGDSDLGSDVNMGCGCVTVNFDGNQKYRTTIGDHCFVGCNTNLIAPVTLDDGAFTAAGSTITKDVSKDALAIARARQLELAGWAANHRKKTSV